MKDDDPELFKRWPSAAEFGTSAAHLHAFGAANLMYNRLEHTMSLIFAHLLWDQKKVSDAIYERLTNRNRIDVMRTTIDSRRTLDPALAECIKHAILCFELCTENRNILMHIIHEHQWQPEDQLLGKKRASDKSRDSFYLLPVATVRQVADDMKSAHDFAMAISLFMWRAWYERTDQPSDDNALWAAIKAAGPNTLPEKPPGPSKLIPLQLDQAQ